MASEGKISPGSIIGFLGPVHTFSHKLALELVPDENLKPFEEFGQVIGSLLDGKCNYALIPFFNNNGHDVLEAQIEIVRYRGKIFIHDLYCIDVRHCACGFGTLPEIKKVVSKRPVEQQISGWLKTAVPGAKFEATKSTAKAISDLSTHRDPSICAIGSIEASRHYDVPVIAEDIQNSPNRTLFLLLSTTCPEVTSVENAVMTLGPTSTDEMGKLIDIAIGFDLTVPAVSSFNLDGVKHAYFEINASYATLNMLSTVQQIKKQFPNATYLGGYNRKSILKLINQK